VKNVVTFRLAAYSIIFTTTYKASSKKLGAFKNSINCSYQIINIKKKWKSWKHLKAIYNHGRI